MYSDSAPTGSQVLQCMRKRRYLIGYKEYAHVDAYPDAMLSTQNSLQH
jgi:hypothetical protein